MKIQTPTKTEFTIEERRVLRVRLISYMKTHAIGVPALHARIIREIRSNADHFQLKTLQRFLAGTVRTADGFLVHCYRFAEAAIPGAAADSLAQAATAFFGSPPPTSGPFIGRWNGLATAGPAGMTVLRHGQDVSSVAASEIAIELSADSSGLITTEWLTKPAGRQAASHDPGFRHVYEGIALQYAPLLCIISKNMLTRLPRNYWLQLGEPDFLYGHGAEAIFMTYTPPKKVVSELAAFRFERQIAET